MGIVTAEMLAARRYPPSLWECGGVELRADGLPPDGVAGAVSDFDNEKGRRGFSGPVILTLRLKRDGGAWPDAGAADRNAVWESLPPGTCDWVDLEVEEIPRVAVETLDSLRSSGVKILLSHHAFVPEAPSVWEAHLETMRAFRPDGVKFAVLPDPDQIPAILSLARKVAAEYPMSCVLGMGPEASVTRVLDPLLGCPFTYGFLGNGEVAPGQLHVTAMQEFFRRAVEGFPGSETSDAALIEWAKDLLSKVSGD